MRDRSLVVDVFLLTVVALVSGMIMHSVNVQNDILALDDVITMLDKFSSLTVGAHCRCARESLCPFHRHRPICWTHRPGELVSGGLHKDPFSGGDLTVLCQMGIAHPSVL